MALDMLLAALSLLLLLVFPGCIYLSLAGWWRRLDLSETVLMVAVASFLLASWLGLVLAETGNFSAHNLVVLVSTVSLVGLLVVMLRSRWPKTPSVDDRGPGDPSSGSIASTIAPDLPVDPCPAGGQARPSLRPMPASQSNEQAKDHRQSSATPTSPPPLPLGEDWGEEQSQTADGRGGLTLPARTRRGPFLFSSLAGERWGAGLSPSGEDSQVPPALPLGEGRAEGVATPGQKVTPYSTILLLILLLVTTALYFRPAESIFGTHDAGARLNAGVHLARTGGFFVDEPTLASAMGTGSLGKFLGVYVVDVSRGRLVPQFNGVYEVWIAISYSILGLTTPLDLLPWAMGDEWQPHLLKRPLFLYVTPLFGLLSVLAIYQVARRLFDVRVGLLAAALLAFSLPQIYYSTLSMSEVLTQLFVLAGLYSFARYQQLTDRWAGVLAGAAAGGAMLVRIDSALVYVPILGWLAALMFRRQFRCHHLCFFGPALALLLHAVIHYAHFSTHYSSQSVISLWQVHHRPIIAAFLALILVSLIAIFARERLTQVLSCWARWITHPVGRVWVSVGVVTLAAYAYLVRPALAQPRVFYSESMREYVTIANEQGMVLLGWYLSPLTLVLATSGLALLAWRGSVGLRAPLIVVGVAYTVFFLNNAFVTPHHVFWVRRFLPVVIPFLYICAAFAVLELTRLRPHRFACMAAPLLALLVIANTGRISWPLVVGPADYQSSLPQVQRFADLFTEDSLVIFEDSYAAHWLAMPLSYLFQRSSYVLNSSEEIDSQAFVRLIEEWREQGQRVYYVAERGHMTLSTGVIDFRTVGEAWFNWPYLDRSYDHLPTNRVSAEFNVEIYELEPARLPAVPSFPYFIDVGSSDYGMISDGFYSRERTAEERYRFTGPAATLVAPWPGARAVTLRIRATGERPDGVPSARARVVINDAEVGVLAFGNDYDRRHVFEVFELAVPPLGVGTDAATTVRIEVNTWRPSDVGLEDSREIGIAIDWIEIEMAD